MVLLSTPGSTPSPEIRFDTSGVPAEATEIDAVLDRLSVVLRDRRPDLWATLRPGADEDDLESLEQAVAPFDLPSEVCAFWRWADGQEAGAPWWPSFDSGPLLPAYDAANQYTWLRERSADPRWCPLWLPLAHDGRSHVGVEIAADGAGVVVDASLPGPPRVIAPTLAALLDATADLLEAPDAARGEDRRWRARRDALLDARVEWARWPFARTLTTVQQWPPYWRHVLGA